jgi:hypothetical protein
VRSCAKFRTPEARHKDQGVWTLQCTAYVELFLTVLNCPLLNWQDFLLSLHVSSMGQTPAAMVMELGSKEMHENSK